MRRGGRALYAFDVTTPTSPAMLWKIGCTGTAMSDTDCGSGTKDYSAIGQTWSPPKIMYASAVGSGATPLILMGGGYDTCEDADAGTGLANHGCASSKGNRVYVIDGTDGTIVREFPTVAPFTGGAARGVVGEATIVSANGIAKYAYIADMGGVVYRLDFTANNKSNWTMTPIAKLGCDTVATCTANRKFMFQPSVVSTDGETFQILLGSGDREKPTTQYGGSNGVTNYFFMLKDKPADNNYLNNACAPTINYMCLASLLPITTSTPSSAAIDGKMGWYLGLQSTEQVVTGAITQFGITTFSTHQPAVSAASCTNNLGTTLVYNISYKDASPVSGNSRYEDLSGDGLPPSPVAGKVLIDGTEVPFCIGCSKDSPLEGKKATQLSGVSRAKSRLYWYLEKN
jgi:type IV pilus assembly protein PilY1